MLLLKRPLLIVHGVLRINSTHVLTLQQATLAATHVKTVRKCTSLKISTVSALNITLALIVRTTLVHVLTDVVYALGHCWAIVYHVVPLTKSIAGHHPRKVVRVMRDTLVTTASHILVRVQTSVTIAPGQTPLNACSA